MNQQRWTQLSLAQQLSQIGSEVSRARHWEMNHDDASRGKALERALELLDLSLEDRRWQRGFKELTRFREVLCDWFCDHKYYDIPAEALEEYCTAFALSARKTA